MAEKPKITIVVDWRNLEQPASSLVNTAPTRDGKWSAMVSCTP